MDKVDIELLKEYIVNGSRKSIEKNDITRFESADEIYACTNEELFLYPSDKAKKVLSVTSGGDHILNAILNGADKIVGFDINRFCKYYSALKIAMIKKYDHKDFFNNLEFVTIFDSYFRKSEETKFKRILNDVFPFLRKEEQIFWLTLSNLYNKKSLSLFDAYSINLDVYNVPWFSIDKYEELKHYLINNKCKIKYIDSNIDTLNEKIKGKFDAIYTSNILGRMDAVSNDDKTKLLLDLGKLLKKGGAIYNYDFWCTKSYEPTDEFNKYFDSSSSKSEKNEFDDDVIIYRKK